MAEPRRMSAIRRLFISKLDAMPSDVPHSIRVEMARSELDKALGPMWREEAKEAGHMMDPTGDMLERMDKLPEATCEAGYAGEDVPPPEKKMKHNPVIIKLMKFFGHGKK